MLKILLYSGGVDSWFINQIWKPDVRLYVDLGTDYGKEEMDLLKKAKENVEIISFDLSEFEMENKIIPLRNLYLIMLACNYSKDEDVEICLGATVGDRNFDKNMPFLHKTEDLLNYIYSPEDKAIYNKKIKINKHFKNKSKTDLLKIYLKNGGDINKAYNETYGEFKENMSVWEKKKFYRKFVCFKLNGFDFSPEIEKEMFEYFKTNELEKTLSLDDERGHEKEEMLKVYYYLEEKYNGDQMYKISFIIPNHNNKLEYIKSCYNSIIKNDELMKISEIVIVDNDSREEISNYVNNLSEMYENVNLVKLSENKGTGFARNLGIELAKGKYIYFVDNDDEIVSTTILKMLKIIEENDLEVLFCDTRDIVNNAILIPKFSLINYFNIEKEEIINANIDEYPNVMYGWACWRFLLNKSFIIENKIKFDDGSIAEDVYFASLLYNNMKKIGIIKNVGYLHRVGVGISKGQHNKEYFKKCANIFEDIIKNYKYHDILYYHILYLELINGMLIENITVSEMKEIIIPILNLIPNEILENLFVAYKNLYKCILDEDEETFDSFKNVFKYEGRFLR